MGELLLELFCEEIPASMQEKAMKDLECLLVAGFEKSGLGYTSVQAYVSPRRLTLGVGGLEKETPETIEEKRGPRVDAPEKAIEGFLRGAGINRSACEERDEKKGRFFYAVVKNPGRRAEDVIKQTVTETIKNFPWPKSQRWGDGSLKWVRPLRRILCLFDGDVIDLNIGSVETGAVTSGHRFHAPDTFSVSSLCDYKQRLLDGKVQIDQNRRAELIVDSARTLASASGLNWVEDMALVKEVAGLVEWPVPMIGSFDPDFLQVPEEVLILTMKKDQRYFVLRDPATGKLAPKFIFVANIEPTDSGAAVIRGNERVLSARLADARFFWEQDLKTPLEDNLPRLAEIVFHDKLGTVADRSRRIADLSMYLAEGIEGADKGKVTRAARFAKADLVSAMVYEFPELQGVMGRYYALAEGADVSVADAVRDHYAPLGPKDKCPGDPVVVVVALAEKLDTLVGFFGIGQLPTGSKDPYALRRAALGVIRLISENGVRLSLRHVFQVTFDNFGAFLKSSAKEQAIEDLLSFFADRLKVIERERGVRHDLIDAVFAKGDDDLVRILHRVKALQQFLVSEDGANLLVGYRRAANILKAEHKKGAALSHTRSVQHDQFKQQEEYILVQALEEAKTDLDDYLKVEKFEEAMSALSRLRVPIDTFFDHVTVNADDAVLRENRLALLKGIRIAAETVADFSLIEG